MNCLRKSIARPLGYLISWPEVCWCAVTQTQAVSGEYNRRCWTCFYVTCVYSLSLELPPSTLLLPRMLPVHSLAVASAPSTVFLLHCFPISCPVYFFSLFFTPFLISSQFPVQPSFVTHFFLIHSELRSFSLSFLFSLIFIYFLFQSFV